MMSGTLNKGRIIFIELFAIERGNQTTREYQSAGFSSKK